MKIKIIGVMLMMALSACQSNTTRPDAATQQMLVQHEQENEVRY